MLSNSPAHSLLFLTSLYPLLLPNWLKIFVATGGGNRLQWELDMVLQEDAAALRHRNAASNWSIIHNLVIDMLVNMARIHKAERFLLPTTSTTYFPF